MDPSICLVDLESAWDVRSLCCHVDWIHHRLSGFPVPPVGRVSGPADRQIIKAVDGRSLSPSSAQVLIGIHRSLFVQLGNSMNTTHLCTRNTEISCAVVNYFPPYCACAMVIIGRIDLGETFGYFAFALSFIAWLRPTLTFSWPGLTLWQTWRE